MTEPTYTKGVAAKQKSKPHLHHFAYEEDGKLYWWATWYTRMLGYKSLSTLNASIEKAKDNCYQLGLSVKDNFIKTSRVVDGRTIQDYKLTKYACFLIATHASSRKVNVRKAQAYFLKEFHELTALSHNKEYIERKGAREEIRRLNRNLNKSAGRSKVRDYSYFTNEGYLGMYNTSQSELKSMRNIGAKEDLYDHLSIVELAAHIFRITMTTERLKHLNNKNEQKAARAHWKIGAQIRAIIKANTGVYPEYLPKKDDLNQLGRKLRAASQVMNSRQTTDHNYNVIS